MPVRGQGLGVGAFEKKVEIDSGWQRVGNNGEVPGLRTEMLMLSASEGGELRTEWVGRPVGFCGEWHSNSSRCGDGTVSFGPAVAIELPHVAHFFDLVQVQICHHHFIFVATAHGAHLAAGIAEI